jgi:hypothetical protein
MADQTYNRIKVATKHLDVALWFFLEMQNFSSALKLAGAAEEAFGKALSSQEGLLRDENSAPASGPFVTLDDLEYAADDLEYAAIWAIVRACDNYNRLGLPRTARMLEFDNWFYENVVGRTEEAMQA